jgi:hypothetical protein
VGDGVNAAANAGLVDLAVTVSPDEVRRCLGCPVEGRLSPRLEARLPRLLADAQPLLAPRGAWRLVDDAQAAAAGLVDAAPRVGVALCTIGPALEAVSARRAAADDLLDALVLDAIGSAAAEAAADALNRALCDAARARGLFAAPRVSPGYGAWDVACQSRLLALLPAAALGVTLTSAQMMIPRKSVSFAINFAATPCTDPDESPCARCGLAHCRHREAR